MEAKVLVSVPSVAVKIFFMGGDLAGAPPHLQAPHGWRQRRNHVGHQRATTSMSSRA